MEYSNQEIPEGINVTRTHPLKEFFILSAGVIGIIVAAVFILSLMAEKLAVFIPFSIEQELTVNFTDAADVDATVRDYLQVMAEDLGKYMDLPEEISITVHYVEDDIKNAFATLGGHVFIYKGLVDMMPHENALAMVMAHEIAHIKHRHPLMAMGRGVVIGLLVAAIAGLDSNLFAGEAINNAGMITILNFSRDQERQADHTGIAALEKYYGHVSGAGDLFRELLKIDSEYSILVPEFLSTHPLSNERIEDLRQYAVENGWRTSQPVQPLPEFFTPTERL